MIVEKGLFGLFSPTAPLDAVYASFFFNFQFLFLPSLVRPHAIRTCFPPLLLY